MCFVAPLYIIHVLLLFINSVLQVIAVIASSTSLDSFCLRFDLQKRLMWPFLPQLKHLSLNLFAFTFSLLRALMLILVCFRSEQFLDNNTLLSALHFSDQSFCLASSSINFCFKLSSSGSTSRNSIATIKFSYFVGNKPNIIIDSMSSWITILATAIYSAFVTHSVTCCVIVMFVFIFILRSCLNSVVFLTGPRDSCMSLRMSHVCLDVVVLFI